MLFLVQRVADSQHILDCGTFQSRAPGDLEISAAVSFRGLAIAFGDVQRDGLARTQPLISGVSMDPGQVICLGEDPGDILNGQAVDVESFVSECSS